MPPIVTGAPVHGPAFFGREKEIDAAWQGLAHGHVLLSAPRRHGKTSLMYQLKDRPRPGWQVVFANVEYIQDPADLLEEMLAGLLANQPLRRSLRAIQQLGQTLRAWLGQALEGFEMSAAGLGQLKIHLRQSRPAQNWVELGNALLDVLARLPERPLIILDELPVFVVDTLLRQDRAEAERFLHWFRAVRQSCRAVSFLVGGSINLEGSLSRCGLSSLINDFERLRLAPFSPELSACFVRGLLHDNLADLLPAQLEPLVEAICAAVGPGVPYYLQVLSRELVDAVRIEGFPARPESVARVYAERVLGPDCRARFDHYRSRLRERFDATGAECARLLLCQLSDAAPHDESVLIQHPVLHGLGDAESAREVLEQLEADYYIQRRAGQVAFLHRVLADWWRLNIRPPRRPQ